MNPTTFLATICSYETGPIEIPRSSCGLSPRLLRLFHLPELELDRCCPPEDRHRHAQLRLVVIDVLDRAVEIRERAFTHPHRLADLEQHLGLGFLHALLHLLQDVLHFLVADGRGLPAVRSADETCDLGRVLHQVPGVVGHVHLDEHVAREELPLGDILLAALHLDHFLGGHQDLAELLLHAGAVDPVEQRLLHRLLEARIGMDHVPALGCVSGHRHFFHPSSRSYIKYSRLLSVNHRNTAIATTNPNTAAAVCSDSLRVGHTTFFVSTTASWANTKNSLPGAVVQPTAAPAASPASTLATRSTIGLSEKK